MKVGENFIKKYCVLKLVGWLKRESKKAKSRSLCGSVAMLKGKLKFFVLVAGDGD